MEPEGHGADMKMRIENGNVDRASCSRNSPATTVITPGNHPWKFHNPCLPLLLQTELLLRQGSTFHTLPFGRAKNPNGAFMFPF